MHLAESWDATVKNWGRSGPDIIVERIGAKQLYGWRAGVVVQENLEAITVYKDGLLHEVCIGGRVQSLGLFEALSLRFGGGPHLFGYWYDTAPITLEFWLQNPTLPHAQSSGDVFGLQALTSDGQYVSAQITLTVSVDPETPHLLLRDAHGAPAYTVTHLRSLVRDELLAKVLGPAIAQRSIDDLRGNKDLLAALYQEVKTQLVDTFRSYGLRLDASQFFVNWGLNQNEADQFEDQRRAQEISQIQHDSDVALLKARVEQELKTVKASDVIAREGWTSSESGHVRVPVPGSDGESIWVQAPVSGMRDKWVVGLMAVVLAGIVAVVYLMAG
jgi:hypothetical protein